VALNTPSGTRGARYTGSNGRFTKWFARQMETRIRRRGYRMMGMDILFLTTTGRRTGQPRQVPVAWFPDGTDAWLVVASLVGAARNPAWYLNMAAHPDQVWIELADRKLRVTPAQLDDAERAVAWPRIVAAQPRYAKYQAKTDRVLPVIRLTPA
jgi:deazaflavin-dependent oxidoreductase (nitroreductase family)